MGGFIDRDFDIKKLLFKRRDELIVEELKSYPFPLIEENNCLKVKIKNLSINYNFSIESLIALQILDIKSDAEKQLSTTFSRAVFTVPTHYTIKEKDAFRDVATIAGFKWTHILSEITAAAIGYSYNVKPKDEMVLFVAINDFESDVSVIKLDYQTIEYQCYSYEKSLGKESFIKQLEHIMKLVRFNKTDIFDIVVVGASPFMPLMRDLVKIFFDRKKSIYHFCSDIVVKGLAVFGKFMAKNNFKLGSGLTEMSFHSLDFQLIGSKSGAFPQRKVFHTNTKIGGFYKIRYTSLKFDLPINIRIIQDNILVKSYQMNSLPSLYSWPIDWNQLIGIILLKSVYKRQMNCDLVRELL